MIDWLQIGLEFLGVFVGVIMAFWLDRRGEVSRERKEAVKLLKLIKEELEKNTGLLDQFRNELNVPPGQIYLPYYRLQLSTWEAISGKMDLIKNDELLVSISQAYFNFDMFTRTLERYLDLAYHLVKERSPAAELREQIHRHRLSMIKQVEEVKNGQKDGILPFTKKVISRIEDEIKHLDC
jgi:hypothetical protein